jgi:molybdopterin-guanine dinucleotide biosynthesis protein A
MGRPKSALLFDGEPLVAHLLRRLAGVFPEIVVVRATDQEVPLPLDVAVSVAKDAVADQGPVAGICAGLAAVRRPLAFVVACDIPFLEPRLGAWMVAQAEGHDVVVPEWEGRLNPLQAVYRTRVLPLLEEQLAAGQRRLVDLYDRVTVRRVSEAEIRAIDPDGLTFLNMNTPEEYDRALNLWRERMPCA